MADRYTRIKIGLVGLGSWARASFVPILKERNDIIVGAVAAPTEMTRMTALEHYGGGIELYKHYSELLEFADVDAVMIGLPPNLTDDASIAAVGAGKHVFVEPPVGNETLAVTVPPRTVFHVDLELRYLPVVAKMREIVYSGCLGPLLQVSVELESDWSMNDQVNDPFQASTVFGLGNWYIDLLDIFMGSEAVRVDIFGNYPKNPAYMEMGTAIVQYADGAIGKWVFNLRVGRELHLKLRVFGSDGQAEADLITGTYRCHLRDGGEMDGDSPCSMPAYGFVGMRESIDAFISSVREGVDSASGMDTYRKLHTVLEALLCSEHEGRSVLLDEM